MSDRQGAQVEHGNISHAVPLDPGGGITACSGDACELPLDPDLIDPYAITVTCRADGLRRSAFVGYLRTPKIGTVSAGTASGSG